MRAVLRYGSALAAALCLSATAYADIIVPPPPPPPPPPGEWIPQAVAGAAAAVGLAWAGVWAIRRYRKAPAAAAQP